MKQKGFTLIELLVTMGIIAVLTGLSIFNFNQSRVRARDVQRKSDLGQLMKALELYKNDNTAYPSDSTDYQQTLINNEYIKERFSDPKGTTDWKPYVYKTLDSSYKEYVIMACLENKADTTKATPDKCFDYFGSNDCKCGNGSQPTNWTGTMYIVSNQ